MTRLALLVIRLATPPREREWVVGDTVEELARIRDASGERAARRWVQREMWRVLVNAPRHRFAVSCGSAVATSQPAISKGDGPVRDFFQDIRYTLRLLGRGPAFTAIAIATLALGIGANTAIFAVVNAVLLKPLPFADAERLMLVHMLVPERERSGVYNESVWSYPKVPDTHRVATGVRRDCFLRGPRPRSLRRRRAAARARRSRHGAVSVRSRRRAVDGTPVHLGRGAHGGHAARRDDQPRLVDAALRRRSRRSRAHDPHQCGAVRRSRRAAAKLPRSDWQRRRLGAARCLRALAADPGAVALVHDRRPPQARRVGANRRVRGRGPRQSGRRRAFAPEHRHGGMDGARQLHVRVARRSRPSSGGAGAARRGRLRAADRVRESDESRRCQGDGPPPRGRRPRRDWRQPRADRAAVRRRRGRVVDARRGRRAVRRLRAARGRRRGHARARRVLPLGRRPGNAANRRRVGTDAHRRFDDRPGRDDARVHRWRRAADGHARVAAARRYRRRSCARSMR